MTQTILTICASLATKRPPQERHAVGREMGRNRRNYTRSQRRKPKRGCMRRATAPPSVSADGEVPAGPGATPQADEGQQHRRTTIKNYQAHSGAKRERKQLGRKAPVKTKKNNRYTCSCKPTTFICLLLHRLQGRCADGVPAVLPKPN